MFGAILEFIRNNGVIITAVSAALYTFFTGLLIWEMRKDRRYSYAPYLDGMIAQFYFPTRIILKVKNSGNGSAIHPVVKIYSNKEKWILSKPKFGIENKNVVEVRSGSLSQPWPYPMYSLKGGDVEEMEFVLYNKAEQNIEVADEIFIEYSCKDIFGRDYFRKISMCFKDIIKHDTTSV